ncbi:MAG TPA: hypothetical protein VNR60_08125 [Croceibacterium sp.]|nr:hypothetical protein [Croceibacterium sp.]
MKGILRLAAVAAAALASLWAAAAQAQSCDRACLGALVTQYVDALIAHDPSTLPLSDKVRFTENGREMELGEGAWKTVTAKTGFRHDYIDTRKQIAVSHVELRDGDVPVLYSLALHVTDGKIAGVESIVHRVTPDSIFQPKVLNQPVRGMDEPAPPGMIQSREDMVAIALRYTEGLRIGNFADAKVPFGPETYRVENGVITAGEGCGMTNCGMYSQRIMLHPSLVPSVVAVDEEKGTVVLWMNFGDTRSYGDNRALVTFEAFRIWGGAIRSINAFFDFLPASTPRFWDSADPLPSRY